MRITSRITPRITAAAFGLVAVAALAGPTSPASAGRCPVNFPITADLGAGFCYQTNPACAVLYTETPVTGRIDIGTSCT